MGFFKDITTGKDNQTHDIVRVSMAAIVVTSIIVFIFGSGMYLYGYLASMTNPNVKPFDIQTFFNATSTQAVALGAFLTAGSAGIFLKKTTEPDGTVTETESITKGKQPDPIAVTNVNVIQ